MGDHDLDVEDLVPAVIERYVAVRCAGYPNLRSVKALLPLLGYLRKCGASPVVVAPLEQTVAEKLLEPYRAYLLSERGLRPRVVRGYLDLVRPFIERVVRDGDRGVGDLSAGDVTSFVVAESRRLAPKTVQRLASALRSLLRFWHVQGLIATPLVGAVPKIAYRSLGLPRALRPSEVAALLSGCDRQSVAGCRDFAMLTLLSRVGLRARSQHCNWLTLNGGAGRSSLLGGEIAATGFPCHRMSVRRSPIICGGAGPQVRWIGACSSGSKRRIRA